MSLYEKLDGILETQVTWGDLEKQLRGSLKTEATFGPAKSVLDIGEGNGFASRCGLITCDWKGASDDEKLPGTVVIKIPSALPYKQMNVIQGDAAMWEGFSAKLRELHNVEIITYNFLEQFDGLMIPKMYYGSSFTPEDKLSEQICLEFVQNSRVMNFHEEHTVEQLKQIARALGKIQACSLKKASTAPELHTNMHADFSKTVSLEAYCGMFKSLLAVDSSDEAKQLLEKIDPLLPEYYASELSSTIHKQMGITPVIVNGDLRTENVLIDKDSGDLLSLIDWQCTHHGVGVQDLLRISLFALPAKERRESATMLVEEMYNSLVANLDGAEAPYSLEKLQTLYDILFPHSASYFAGGGIVMTNKLVNKADLPMEEKEKGKAVQLNKVIGALEDIVDYHAKNKDLVKDLKFRGH